MTESDRLLGRADWGVLVQFAVYVQVSRGERG
jgi:hypothetical protein